MEKKNEKAVEMPYIKLYPDLIELSIFADVDLLKLWILCLMLAGRGPRRYYVPHHLLLHKFAIVDLEVGQILINEDELHEVFFTNIDKPHLRPKDLWRKLQELQLLDLVELEELKLSVEPEVVVYCIIITVKRFGLGG